MGPDDGFVDGEAVGGGLGRDVGLSEMKEGAVLGMTDGEAVNTAGKDDGEVVGGRDILVGVEVGAIVGMVEGNEDGAEDGCGVGLPGE